MSGVNLFNLKLDVTRVLQGCLLGVSIVLQGYSKSVLRVFQGFSAYCVSPGLEYLAAFSCVSAPVRSCRQSGSDSWISHTYSWPSEETFPCGEACTTQAGSHTDFCVCYTENFANFLQNVEFSFRTQNQNSCTFQGFRRWHCFSEILFPSDGNSGHYVTASSRPLELRPLERHNLNLSWA